MLTASASAIASLPIILDPPSLTVERPRRAAGSPATRGQRQYTHAEVLAGEGAAWGAYAILLRGGRLSGDNHARGDADRALGAPRLRSTAPPKPGARSIRTKTGTASSQGWMRA